MAKKRSTVRKPTKAMAAAQARIATQEELITLLREANADAQQEKYTYEREIHRLKLKPTQIRRVVRVIEYVGDPKAIADTLMTSLPQGVNDRGSFSIAVTMTEDVTRDVIVRAEAKRG